MGLACAVIALGLLLAFVQSSRRGFAGPLLTYFGLAQIPLVVMLLWRIALDLTWWTVLVFVGVAVTSGIINGVLARSAGPLFLLWVQPYLAVGVLLLSALCWVF